MAVSSLSANDRHALDWLIGRALVDERVCYRTLHERTDDWLAQFSLSKGTRSWLLEIYAETLEEFAQAILLHI